MCVISSSFPLKALVNHFRFSFVNHSARMSDPTCHKMLTLGRCQVVPGGFGLCNVVPKQVVSRCTDADILITNLFRCFANKYYILKQYLEEIFLPSTFFEPELSQN